MTTSIGGGPAVGSAGSTGGTGRTGEGAGTGGGSSVGLGDGSVEGSSGGRSRRLSVGSGVDGLVDGVLLLLERDSFLETDGWAELDIVEKFSFVRSLHELDLVSTTLRTSRPVGSSSVAGLSSEVGDVEFDGSDGSISS